MVKITAAITTRNSFEMKTGGASSARPQTRVTRRTTRLCDSDLLRDAERYGCTFACR